MSKYKHVAGFLILEHDAEIPIDIPIAPATLPAFCGAGEDAEATTAVITSKDSYEALQAELAYPIYKVANPPEGVNAAAYELVQNSQSSEANVYGCFIDFASELGEGNAPMRLVIEKEFAKPYPIWKPNPNAEWGAETEIEEVDFLPAPGLRIRRADSTVFQWISYDVLYTLYVETAGTRDISDYYPEFVHVDVAKTEVW